MAKTLVLELPEDVYSSLEAFGLYEEQLANEAKKYLASGLFQKKMLSLGKTSELAEMGLKCPQMQRNFGWPQEESMLKLISAMSGLRER